MHDDETRIDNVHDAVGYRHRQTPRQEGCSYRPKERGPLPLAPCQGPSFEHLPRLKSEGIPIFNSSIASWLAGPTPSSTRSIKFAKLPFDYGLKPYLDSRSSSTASSSRKTTAPPSPSQESSRKPLLPPIVTPRSSSRLELSPMTSA